MDAAGLITTWQSVKADALGPKHAVGRLEEVLEGKLWDEWHRRAQELKAQNWCGQKAVTPVVRTGHIAGVSQNW